MPIPFLRSAMLLQAREPQQYIGLAQNKREIIRLCAGASTAHIEEQLLLWPEVALKWRGRTD
ncbi:hypothetical protein HK14_01540 [Acetobacter cibinongensis]|uniref:Uncharacterized protein n=1 Tax=Acetobacter cibinongensis TaxID=146475 RepID=A0A1Z5YWW1_9PROT|nr:hypothetical protein HK14_01540 [Acetobacter cibinongensis]